MAYVSLSQLWHIYKNIEVSLRDNNNTTAISVYNVHGNSISQNFLVVFCLCFEGKQNERLTNIWAIRASKINPVYTANSITQSTLLYVYNGYEEIRVNQPASFLLSFQKTCSVIAA